MQTTTDRLKLQYIEDAAKGSELIQAVCNGGDQFVARIVAEERVRELEEALRGKAEAPPTEGKPVLGQTPEGAGITDPQEQEDRP